MRSYQAQLRDGDGVRNVWCGGRRIDERLPRRKVVEMTASDAWLKKGREGCDSETTIHHRRMVRRHRPFGSTGLARNHVRGEKLHNSILHIGHKNKKLLLDY